MKPGTPIKCIEDYDLFDTNMRDQLGCCVCEYTDRGKYLIWFPCNGEYAELSLEQMEEVSSPDKDVLTKCREHCSNVRKL